MLQIGGNIKLIRKIADVTQGQFGDIVGVSKDMIKSYEGKKETMPDDLIIARICKFTSVSEKQLKEKKLREEDINLTPTFLEEVEKVNPESAYLKKTPKRENSYIIKRRELKNSDNPAIPIYESAPFTLSNTPSVRDENNTNNSPDFWVSIPNLRDCNYGARAKGDSMYPLIRSNALVIGKEITDMGVIVFGEIYIIRTKNGIDTVKYIQPHEKDENMVWLVPYNSKANKTPIHKSDILKLYEAKAVFNTI